jgi:DNA invertase Pin-like site-specific DNA recombinase
MPRPRKQAGTLIDWSKVTAQLNGGRSAMPKDWTPVVAYARMSDEAQAGSIEQQLNDVRAWAVEKRYWIIAEYLEPATSGRKDDKRPEFQRMIDDAKPLVAWRKNPRRHPRPAFYFELVIAWHSNRFSRAKPLKAAKAKDVLCDAGVRLDTYSEGVTDWSKGLDVVMDTLRQHANAEYSREFGQKSVRGRNDLIRAGEWPHGAVPYGYDRVYVDDRGKEHFVARTEKFKKPSSWTRRLVVNEDEKAVVLRIFDLYLVKRWGRLKIANRLTDEGVPSPGGAAVWNEVTILNILSNPAYAGYGHVRVEGRHQDSHYAESETAMAAGLYPGMLEAFVAEDEWRTVCDRLAVNKAATRKRRETRTPALLAGLVYCSRCGFSMPAKTRCGRYVFTCMAAKPQQRQCRGWSVYEDQLLPLVIRRLSHALDRKVLELAAAPAEQPEDGAALKRLRTRIAELDRVISTGSKRLLSVPDKLRERLERELLAYMDEQERAQRDLDAMTAPSGAVTQTVQAIESMRAELLTIANPLIELGGKANAAYQCLDGSRVPVRVSPAVRVNKDDLRSFLRRIGFRVTCYFKPRGPAGRFYALDSGRLECDFGDAPMPGRTSTPWLRGVVDHFTVDQLITTAGASRPALIAG